MNIREAKKMGATWTLRLSKNCIMFKIDRVYYAQLYSTQIFKFDLDTNKVMVNTGGWNTHTTRRMINEALKQVNLYGLNVVSRDYTPHLICSLESQLSLPFDRSLTVQLTNGEPVPC